jgi:hypothetical protein
VNYFTGGGLPQPADFVAPFGFVPATEPRPAGHRIVALKCFPVAPESVPARFVKYEPIPLEPSEQEQMRKRAEALRVEISRDDAAALVAREFIFFGVRRGGCRR